ncbi:hypothetical protein NDU88_000203 [Pleurodeles waltl]|uniref:Uncharacterized protein n=1 Tax=Pleurodeles waltl TaxID=8319 RepID=A0AAV7P4C1_PLEWA|nr:hypothetical protein NDU88_000203 [Pleurodeles waltl]
MPSTVARIKHFCACSRCRKIVPFLYTRSGRRRMGLLRTLSSSGRVRTHTLLSRALSLVRMLSASAVPRVGSRTHAQCVCPSRPLVLLRMLSASVLPGRWFSCACSVRLVFRAHAQSQGRVRPEPGAGSAAEGPLLSVPFCRSRCPPAGPLTDPLRPEDCSGGGEMSGPEPGGVSGRGRGRPHRPVAEAQREFVLPFV